MKASSPNKVAVATALLLSGAARAQQQYRIDPQSVSNTTRDFWCQQQITQCPLICLDQGSSTGTTSSNECDSESLTYACVCDNGNSPNVSEYSNTLPYSICTQWGTQCVSNCGSDTECASDCRQNHPCGAQNPTRQNTSTLTTSMMASTTMTGSMGSAGASDAQTTDGPARVTTESDGSTVTVYSGLVGQTTNGESAGVKNVRVWALGMGQTFGTVGVLGAAALGFAVLL